MVPRKGTLAYLCDVITQTLGASIGGKAAEKMYIAYHFVIWSMQAFVSTRFHVVPRKSMLAFFFFGGGVVCQTDSIITAKCIQSDPAEITFHRWFLT